MSNVQDWPRFKTYEGAHLRRIALPLGGIGTGTVSLGGRGDLRDWELVNRPAKGFSPDSCFLALRTQTQSGDTFARVLEGPIPPEDYEGAWGCPVPNAGLPRFASATFHATYPLGEVELRDDACPLNVSLRAFNPFVPANANASGHPIAVLRVRLHNPTQQAVRASVVANLKNWLGNDGEDSKTTHNRNTFRDETVRGVLGETDLPPDAPLFGTLALGVFERDLKLSHRVSWANLSWGDALLDFWDDFADDGALQPREAGQTAPVASLCAELQIASQETREVTFLLAWNFPNRQTWTPQDGANNTIGNFYTTQSANAWDALIQFAAQLPELEAQTLSFARAFYSADLPDVVKEAAGFNLSTLRTQTVFRTPDGKMFGWEGCGPHHGSCHGSCTHVWNYEYATAFLFGDLARSMRTVEFAHATDARGFMSFRASLPLSLMESTDLPDHVAAADGQCGCLLKLYRDWKLSGDDSFLRELWPHARRALEFCWIPNGWDGDRDGVMEGCQHNTMDVEYFGPNPQMQGWYLAALRAGEEMARYLGDADFADECRSLYEQGRDWTRLNLWNGDYFEHQVRPPLRAENVAPGLRLGAGAHDLENPELQLGAGCLVDQLVGGLGAQLCGLGNVFDQEQTRTTLHSILRFNRRDSLRSHFNHLRSFALGDEAALLMASYPKGRRPARPFPYYNEVMTGFEQTVGVHLLLLGERDAGLQVFSDIRARYDGRKRNPFDEAECGHHYARAMTSWASVLALTGFAWNAHSGTLTFAASDAPATWFWSNGGTWGTLSQAPRETEIEAELRVLGGKLPVRRLVLRDYGEAAIAEAGRVVVRRA